MLPLLALMFACSDYSLSETKDVEPVPVAPVDSDSPPLKPPVTDDPVVVDSAEPADDPIVDTDTPELPVDTDLPIDTDLPVQPRDPDCALDPHLVQTFEVFFPARQDCQWNTGGNLAPNNEHNTAQAIDTAVVQLPTTGTLCDLDIASSTSNLEFDDHFTLTLDEWVLVGGGSGYPMTALQEFNGLYRYDWSRIAGTPFADRDAAYWCLGQPDSTCTVPPTEQAGRLDIDLEGPMMARLTDEMRNRQDLPFALRVFGDDNVGDCRHTDVRLQVTIAWVQ
ncbi:MAG: hypothetical protein H6733_13440 [Alphaproteobacteria bacterium]|nr:hypothetical protein [Alphaproteobacteria bacterium]